jgi:hypothetical protein
MKTSMATLTRNLVLLGASLSLAASPAHAGVPPSPRGEKDPNVCSPGHVDWARRRAGDTASERDKARAALNVIKQALQEAKAAEQAKDAAKASQAKEKAKGQLVEMLAKSVWSWHWRGDTACNAHSITAPNSANIAAQPGLFAPASAAANEAAGFTGEGLRAAAEAARIAVRTARAAGINQAQLERQTKIANAKKAAEVFRKSFEEHIKAAAEDEAKADAAAAALISAIRALEETTDEGKKALIKATNGYRQQIQKAGAFIKQAGRIAAFTTEVEDTTTVLRLVEAIDKRGVQPSKIDDILQRGPTSGNTDVEASLAESGFPTLAKPFDDAKVALSALTKKAERLLAAILEIGNQAVQERVKKRLQPEASKFYGNAAKWLKHLVKEIAKIQRAQSGEQ